MFCWISFLCFCMLGNLQAQEPTLVLPVGHTGLINTAEFSHDGKQVVTASNDNTAKLWDVETGNLLLDINGHNSWVLSAHFSPDGKHILTASKDATAKMWDATTGNLLFVIKADFGPLTYATFNSDGSKIFTTYDTIAKFWDARTGEFLFNLQSSKEWMLDASFSPDGKYLVTASGNHTVILWNALTGEKIKDLYKHSKWITSVRFSHDGSKIVSAAEDKTAKIYNVSTGETADLDGHRDDVVYAEFSLDGKQVITASKDSTIKVWDAEHGKLFFTLNGHHAAVTTAHFSIDGKQIATGARDKTMKIWDAATGKLLYDLRDHKAFISQLAFSPDGKRIITASGDRTAILWSVPDARPLVSLKGHSYNFYAANFSADSNYILTASEDGKSKMWDAATAKWLFNFAGHSMRVTSAEFSKDLLQVITASGDSTIKVWDAMAGQLSYTIMINNERVRNACFSPDGKFIIASCGNTTKVYDVVARQWLYDIGQDNGLVLSSQFNTKGDKMVAACFKNTAQVWNVNNWSLRFELKHTRCVNYARFSPAGDKIVTASDDKLAKVWNADNGNFLFDLKGHKEEVIYACFSPDGKTIVTASKDNTAKIWDAETGKWIADLVDHKGALRSAEYSPDNSKIITASADNTLKVWDAKHHSIIFTLIGADSSDYLVVDEYNHYDGTAAARKLLYFTCGSEIISLDQVKDQLWVPNLAHRLMNGETINAPKLSDLNICGLTPEVIILNDNEKEFKVKITARKGGLGETVLYINNIEARRYQPGDLQKNGNDLELTVLKNEFAGFIIPGEENNFLVKTFTTGNEVSSRGIKVTGVADKSKTERPNLYAVMVGVSDYKGDKIDLKYAAKDAEDLSAAVAATSRRMLNTDGKEHVFVYNLNTGKNRDLFPDKNSIKNVFDSISKRSTANDILLIFFAGHGVMLGEKKMFYFLTADAAGFDDAVSGGVSSDELSEWIKPQHIKAQKRILIFDACNSGQAINDMVQLGDNSPGNSAARGIENGEQIKAIDKLNEKSGLFILSASATNQSAYEMSRYSQGVLTYSLLKAIKEEPDILENQKFLNVSRWFNAAEKMVSDLAKSIAARQDPQIVSTTNFNMGIVDDSVRARIITEDEKPLFGSSNFQNNDELISDDNLQLNKLLNGQLATASNNAENGISFIAGSNSPDAYSLSGRYIVNERGILLKVNIKQGGQLKHHFEVNGKKDNLEALAKKAVDEVTVWLKLKK